MTIPEHSERRFGHRRHAGKLLASALEVPSGPRPPVLVALSGPAVPVLFEIAQVLSGPVGELVSVPSSLRSFRPAPQAASFHLPGDHLEVRPASLRTEAHDVILVVDASPARGQISAAVDALRAAGAATVTVACPAMCDAVLAEAAGAADTVVCLRVASPRVADAWYLAGMSDADDPAVLLRRARKRFSRRWARSRPASNATPARLDTEPSAGKPAGPGAVTSGTRTSPGAPAAAPIRGAASRSAHHTFSSAPVGAVASFTTPPTTHRPH